MGALMGRQDVYGKEVVCCRLRLQNQVAHEMLLRHA